MNQRLGLLISAVIYFAIAQSGFAAPPEAIQCGNVIRSVFKSQPGESFIQVSTFTKLVGAKVIVTVPASEERCILVTLYAAGKQGNSNVCLAIPCSVRATDNGDAMPPGEIGLLGSSMIMQWGVRATTGTHDIQIEVKDARFDKWSMHAEITE